LAPCSACARRPSSRLQQFLALVAKPRANWRLFSKRARSATRYCDLNRLSIPQRRPSMLNPAKTTNRLL